MIISFLGSAQIPFILHDSRDVNQGRGIVVFIADLEKTGKSLFEYFPGLRSFPLLIKYESQVVKSGRFGLAISDFACDSEYFAIFRQRTGIVTTIPKHPCGHFQGACNAIAVADGLVNAARLLN